MPATFEAVRSALAALADAAPEWIPATHTDIGGGTGAATWAVAEAWQEEPASTVVDWAEPALALGRELAEASGSPALRAAAWQRSRIGSALRIESTDLVTVSYVLKELTAADRAHLVTEAARAARAVVVVEPGTPDGYLRVIEASSSCSTRACASPPPARTAAPAPSSPAPTGATSRPG